MELISFGLGTVSLIVSFLFFIVLKERNFLTFQVIFSFSLKSTALRARSSRLFGSECMHVLVYTVGICTVVCGH